MPSFFNQVFLENTVYDWLIALLIILGGFICIKFIQKTGLPLLRKRADKTKADFDNFIVSLMQKCLIPYLYIICVVGALNHLPNPPRASWLHIVLLLTTTFFVLRTITLLLQYLVVNFLRNQKDGDTKQKQVRGILIILKVMIWIFGVIFLMDNLGYNITSLIAGLGIGGIAIALAAQTILGDLFSYFVILFDRPFEIGDFIIVDDKMGVVEYIGIKTTRLKTLSGEQLVFSNKNLTESRIHNFQRMQQRRAVFTLGVTYQTPADTLANIPALVKEIILREPDVIFDRGHFSAFGPSSLVFEFVYYILSSDYVLYMDRQQAIYLSIFREFEARGIKFAYPTQTLFVNTESKQPAIK